CLARKKIRRSEAVTAQKCTRLLSRGGSGHRTQRCQQSPCALPCRRSGGRCKSFPRQEPAVSEVASGPGTPVCRTSSLGQVHAHVQRVFVRNLGSLHEPLLRCHAAVRTSCIFI